MHCGANSLSPFEATSTSLSYAPAWGQPPPLSPWRSGRNHQATYGPDVVCKAVGCGKSSWHGSTSCYHCGVTVWPLPATKPGKGNGADKSGGGGKDKGKGKGKDKSKGSKGEAKQASGSAIVAGGAPPEVPQAAAVPVAAAIVEAAPAEEPLLDLEGLIQSEALLAATLPADNIHLMGIRQTIQGEKDRRRGSKVSSTVGKDLGACAPQETRAVCHCPAEPQRGHRLCRTGCSG